jgi:hypothetical protein
VPLEDLQREPAAERELSVVELERPPRLAKPVEPRTPLTFKVVDVMSARLVAEGVSAAETVKLLEGVRSVLDVRIYAWMTEAGRWRLLTLEEQRTLWGFRRPAQVTGVPQ